MIFRLILIVSSLIRLDVDGISHELLTQLLRESLANNTVTIDLSSHAFETMAVANPHEWELLLSEAWGPGIGGLPETAESGKGCTIWDRMRLDQAVMGGAIAYCSVVVHQVSVSAGLGQEG